MDILRPLTALPLSVPSSGSGGYPQTSDCSLTLGTVLRLRWHILRPLTALSLSVPSSGSGGDAARLHSHSQGDYVGGVGAAAAAAGGSVSADSPHRTRPRVRGTASGAAAGSCRTVRGKRQHRTGRERLDPWITLRVCVGVRVSAYEQVVFDISARGDSRRTIVANQLTSCHEHRQRRLCRAPDQPPTEPTAEV